MVAVVNKSKIISVNMPGALLEGLDALVKAGRYPSRAEVVRVAVRDMLMEELGEEFYNIVNRVVNDRVANKGVVEDT